MAFALPHELASVLGVDFDTEETSRAELLLGAATALIQRLTSQTIEAGSSTVTYEATGSRRLQLPQIPVTAVTSVTVDGTLWPAADYLWNAQGGLLPIWPRWRWRGTVVVAYSHGFATVPADLKLLTLNLVARGWSNPTGDKSESLGDYAHELASPSVASVSEADMSLLEAYKPAA